MQDANGSSRVAAAFDSFRRSLGLGGDLSAVGDDVYDYWAADSGWADAPFGSETGPDSRPDRQAPDRRHPHLRFRQSSTLPRLHHSKTVRFGDFTVCRSP